MSRGRTRIIHRIGGGGFKGVGLTPEERELAMSLQARRFPVLAIARAIGRPLPTVAAFLASIEAEA